MSRVAPQLLETTMEALKSSSDPVMFLQQMEKNSRQARSESTTAADLVFIIFTLYLFASLYYDYWTTLHSTIFHFWKVHFGDGPWDTIDYKRFNTLKRHFLSLKPAFMGSFSLV
jgi:hypothetical protein